MEKQKSEGKRGQINFDLDAFFSQSTEVKVTFFFILGMDEYFISKLMDIGLDEIE